MDVTHPLQKTPALDDLWLDIRLHPALEGLEGRAWLEIRTEDKPAKPASFPSRGAL